MTGAGDFAANNSAFIHAGLHWLRALLVERRSPAPTAIAVPQVLAPRGRRRFGLDWAGGDATVVAAPPALPLPETAATRAEEFAAAAAAQPAPALVALADSFGLSPFERNIVLLCAMMEFDPGLPALLAAHDPLMPALPTFALALSLFDEPSWDALAPGGALRKYQLVEVHQTGATALLAAPLRIDERIAAYVKGLNYLDERLLEMADRVAPPADPLPPSQAALAQRIADWAGRGSDRTLIALVGGDRAAKREVAAAALAARGIALFELHPALLPREPALVARFAALWEREVRLLPIALLAAPPEAPAESGDGAGRPPPGWEAVLRLHGIVLLDVAAPNPGIPAHLVEIAPPTSAERRALWAEAMPQDASADPAEWARLAAEFALPATKIREAIAATALEADGPPGLDLLWAWCVAHAGGALDGLAERIEPRSGIDAVKLPARDREQLERLIRHARSRGKALERYGFAALESRGLGLAVLFHGESGTGKTMAAEAVAGELGLALFRVDLASIMSKYIGDTSKKLRAIFDAAEGGGVMLLFDEADAVFGRRSEVKDSHDRFANIDINYLLTRMESFSGITVLATNMKHALDPAFLRRLRFVIGFGFPGVAEREAIWRGVFPEAAPLDELDYAALARFPLTGGSIFNAAIGAAHEAAAEDAPIAMRHVLGLIRAEFQKLERPVPEHEFAGLRRVPAGVRS